MKRAMTVGLLLVVAALISSDLRAPADEAAKKAQRVPFAPTALAAIGGDQTKAAKVIDGEDVLVVIATAPGKKTKRVLAYSHELDTWSTVEIDAPAGEEVQVSVAGRLVAARFERRVYAFSATCGVWDSIVLPADSKAVPLNDGKIIQMFDRQTLYVFGARAKKWKAVDLRTGELVDPHTL